MYALSVCTDVVVCSFFFFFNDTATTEIYTLSLHDALPICSPRCAGSPAPSSPAGSVGGPTRAARVRSEEHTSELQSLAYLVCRLLLEKKKKDSIFTTTTRENTAHER